MQIAGYMEAKDKSGFSPKELTEFVHEQIPLARALGVKVTDASIHKVELTAPLEMNSNHMETAFGGSLSSVLILACYSWLFLRLKEEGSICHVIIKQGNTDYLLPVKEEIKAICVAPLEIEYEKFLNSFHRKNVGRIFLQAQILTAQGPACVFLGEFVAQKKQS